jgi:hypothetical protein
MSKAIGANQESALLTTAKPSRRFLNRSVLTSYLWHLIRWDPLFLNSSQAF